MATWDQVSKPDAATTIKDIHGYREAMDRVLGAHRWLDHALHGETDLNLAVEAAHRLLFEAARWLGPDETELP